MRDTPGCDATVTAGTPVSRDFRPAGSAGDLALPRRHYDLQPPAIARAAAARNAF
jgi:hypothetical protein